MGLNPWSCGNGLFLCLIARNFRAGNEGSLLRPIFISGPPNLQTKETMTFQTPEIIMYQGVKRQLYGEPLQAFLDNYEPKNMDPSKLKTVSSALWRGYQGRWILKSDQLYLTHLKNSEFSMMELFQTRGHVLADWFSGTLKIGLEDFHTIDPFGEPYKLICLKI